jgi:hypothetical protein
MTSTVGARVEMGADTTAVACLGSRLGDTGAAGLLATVHLQGASKLGDFAAVHESAPGTELA